MDIQPPIFPGSVWSTWSMSFDKDKSFAEIWSTFAPPWECNKSPFVTAFGRPGLV